MPSHAWLDVDPIDVAGGPGGPGGPGGSRPAPSMGFHGDLMVFHGDLMEFNGAFIGMLWDLMVIEWKLS